MPRRFDRSRVRAVRRGKEMHQKDLGRAVGVTGPTVARWENGDDFPKGEKLPGIADALELPLDELFPNEGPIDLQLLRCDAGLSVAEAAAVIGTSRVPVSYAETGRRPLSDQYVDPLARAYGVTRAELLAAQDRSFKIKPALPSPPKQPAAPRTVGEKINYFLQHGYAGRTTPTDQDIALVVNDHAGEALVTAASIAALRNGTTTEVPQVVRAGLAHALDLDQALLEDDAELNPETLEVFEAIRFLATVREGRILGLAARGNQSGLSREMLAKIVEVATELKDKLPPDTQDHA
ncbi:helix-turn-helix domain-containing protein [Streptomyces goshikiensis]|uniref:helix-turn-helix domain-containing protein n=1 Tax=Streptomyces goshikiensis TaxID=1942 RepID=UPI003699FB85